MTLNASSQLKETANKAHDIYESHIKTVAKKFKFSPEPSRAEINQSPLVLVIGNHSSGKSSFINQILGLDIQRTSLAPMDDGFTIIAHGDGEEIDGAAVVSNEEWCYQGLQDFGPGLVSHVVMKRRDSDVLKDLTIVDSPGMIDARVDPGSDVHDRGYDFLKVVRWFAQRADVILLFFDPDNPGTTGETLKILKEALQDLDHKLELIMNKVDRFSNHRDFARCYGALCWNLARAIPRLDLPHINIMYLKGHDTPENHLPLKDFDDAREEVFAKVRNAPAKRVDNIVTQIYEYARALRVHARVIEQARRDFSGIVWKLRGLTASIFLLGSSVTSVVYTTTEDSPAGWGSSLVMTLVLTGLAYFGLDVFAKRYQADLLERLNAVFEKAFHEELTLGHHSEDLRALWAGVSARVRLIVEGGAGSLPKLKAKELGQLDHAIVKMLPALRGQIHPGKKEKASEDKE